MINTAYLQGAFLDYSDSYTKKNIPNSSIFIVLLIRIGGSKGPNLERYYLNAKQGYLGKLEIQYF